MHNLREKGAVHTFVNVDDAEVNRRAGHIAAEYDGKVLVWGGYFKTNPPLSYTHKYWRPNWLMVYHPQHGTWHPMYTDPHNCPPPISAATGVVYGDTLYIFCGFAAAKYEFDEETEGILLRV